MLSSQWNTSVTNAIAKAIPPKIATIPPKVDKVVAPSVVCKNIAVTAPLSPAPIPVARPEFGDSTDQ